MSMAGPSGLGPEVLTTPTTNPGLILDGLHRTKVKGQSHFYTAIMIASLALKHRQNKSQRQRIIVFVCSPIADSQATLVKLAKRMKKNNTSVDLVAFGDLTDENLEKLRAFNEGVKGGEGSHLEIVPPGPNLLSDSIVASPILAGEGGGAAAAGGAGGAEGGAGGAGAGENFEFGVDPSLDPELALVLRMSMEEERERQAREQRQADEAEGKTQLESVPEAQEGEGSGGAAPKPEAQGDGSGEGKSGDDGKKEDEDKMDTA